MLQDELQHRDWHYRWFLWRFQDLLYPNVLVFQILVCYYYNTSKLGILVLQDLWLLAYLLILQRLLQEISILLTN